MTSEELIAAQIRMTAMHAAITFYCCHQNKGGNANDSGNTPLEQIPEQLQYLLEELINLRDILLETALRPGPI